MIARVADDLRIPDIGDFEGRVETERPAVKPRIHGFHLHVSCKAGPPIACYSVTYRCAC